MSAPRTKRRRLDAADARERILVASEALFASGGVDAVRVQLVAKKVGITDAAVHYHFANREGLVEALLSRIAKKLKGELSGIVRGGLATDLDGLATVFRSWYDERGYARLAMWLTLSGWSDERSGMLSDLVKGLHRRRAAGAKLEHTRLVVAWFHAAMIADALFGGAVLRSAGLSDTPRARRRFRELMTQTLTSLLGPGSRARRPRIGRNVA